MRLAAAILAALVFAAPVAAVEHQTVYGTCEWTPPTWDPEWQPWMAGQLITVEFQVVTVNGSWTYYDTATIDYGSCSTSCVMDVTGLSGNYPYIFSVRVPPQTISSGGQSATIRSLLRWGYFYADDGFQPSWTTILIVE